MFSGDNEGGAECAGAECAGAECAGAVDADKVMNELGQGRRFHLLNYALVAIVTFVAALYGVNYVFLAGDVPYRCVVPECEPANSSVFAPAWWSQAAPGARCQRRRLVSPEWPCDHELATFSDDLSPCDTWIYGSNDTIVAEFNLACQDWKRTLVGTIHSIGVLVSMPIFGYISDRWGRKRALTLSCTVVGVIGTLKAFSVSYVMYTIIEFLETLGGASIYPTAFIITVELLGHDKRVLMTGFLGIMLSLGGIVFALLAKTFRYWRTFILVAYPPSSLFVLYFFFLPESVRWLLSKGKKREAVELIMRAAKMNGVTMPDDIIKQLKGEDIKVLVNKTEKNIWSHVVRSRIIMTRLIICSWWWITCSFVLYGLTINSVSLAGDKYTNYMLVMGVEVIAVVLNSLILDRVGRKLTLFSAFNVCGISCIAIVFIPKSLPWLVTVLFLLGKVTITQAFGGIYMYTSELFPTHARHSLLGFCSMVGRVGAIVAPQMPLLEIYIEWLPSVLFGTTALIAGALILATPETLHTRLPDTFQEAESISKNKTVFNNLQEFPRPNENVQTLSFILTDTSELRREGKSSA